MASLKRKGEGRGDREKGKRGKGERGKRGKGEKGKTGRGGGGEGRVRGGGGKGFCVCVVLTFLFERLAPLF